MIVLSVFDGLGGARIALNNVKTTYYSSEIDKYASSILIKNYPDIIELGDIRNVRGFGVDLLVGGSPCQNLTSHGDRKGLDGDKSNLFFEYLRLLEECKPKHFLLENVASMDKKSRESISNYLGVQPILINSANFSPQRRSRLYWTNIILGEIPVLCRDVVKDVWEGDVSGYDVSVTHLNAFKRNYPNFKLQKLEDKCMPLTASYGRQPPHCPYVECKLSQSGVRRLTETECEKLQMIPVNYTQGVSKIRRYKMIGNSFTVSVIKWIFSHVL